MMPNDRLIRTLAPAGAVAACLMATQSAWALDVSLTDGGTVERLESAYTCKDGRSFDVAYINAGSVSLAVIPTPEETELVFVAVMSGSGSRYVANEYQWWVKGNEATLLNLMDGPDSPGVSCSTE